MTEKEQALLIERLAKLFAMQSLQIKTLQTLLFDAGVTAEGVQSTLHAHRKQSFQRDVKFFRQHLLGQFSGQARTHDEELRLLNDLWASEGSPLPPEDAEPEAP